ncbi:UNVERIFIED_CONTAM: hypothetical protein PYX00_005382 [Menopon gallinae]|uniref:Uncharacterized protein n=1 Tax=Menopon gallinae TaxID=328185 RepID=A0AAW2HR23_9NEOP
MAIVADDIPIIPKDESAGGGEGKNLTSISEEKEEDPGLSQRGSSLRGKDAVTKNLQKLGIGKKFKESKSGKSTGSGAKDAPEKRQSIQLSSLKEKVSLKSPVVQNGEYSQSEGDSPMLLKKKGSVENGPSVDGDNMGYVNEGQVLLTTGSVEENDLDETVICLDSSPSAHRKFDDKPLMQVSSV